MEPCSTCCCPLNKTFCNPCCFNLNTRRAELFFVAARTEDEVWHSVNCGKWLVKARDICEISGYLQYPNPVYIAMYCGHWFQGIAQILSYPSCCNEVYVQWHYIKCIHMCEFFRITGLYTYTDMLQLSQNLVLKFMLKFHCYCCPCQCCCSPCPCPGNCCASNCLRNDDDGKFVALRVPSSQAAELHVFVMRGTEDDIKKWRTDGSLSYSPNGSLQDPAHLLLNSPVYICFENITKKRYIGLAQVLRFNRSASDGHTFVHLDIRWKAENIVPSLPGIQTVKVGEVMEKIFFLSDAEKLLNSFDAGVSEQLLKSQPECSHSVEGCCTYKETECTIVEVKDDGDSCQLKSSDDAPLNKDPSSAVEPVLNCGDLSVISGDGKQCFDVIHSCASSSNINNL